LAAKTLKDMGLPRVSHIDSGFNGWRDAGLPVLAHDDWKADRADSGR
jgi:rhodanese-related sulfurtransferase